jgi:hypothetical protein
LCSHFKTVDPILSLCGSFEPSKRELSIAPLYDLLPCFVQKLEHKHCDTKNIREKFEKNFNQNLSCSHFKTADPILSLCGSFEPSKRELSIALLYDMLACFVQKLEHKHCDTKNIREKLEKKFNQNLLCSHLKTAE